MNADGPRTTAAEWAETIKTAELSYYYRVMSWMSYRNAAADEGARYAEAVRGARAMRDTAMNDSHADIAWATEEELECGTPKGWEMGAWPTGAVAPGRFGWAFPE